MPPGNQYYEQNGILDILISKIRIERPECELYDIISDDIISCSGDLSTSDYGELHAKIFYTVAMTSLCK